MDFEKLNTISQVHHYKKKGFKNAKIGRMLGIHRNTVKTYLDKNPDESIRWIESQQSRSKKLDPYKEKILDWLSDEPELSAAQVEDWLKEQFNYYEAAPSTIRSYVKELREQYGIPKVMTYRNYEAVPELPMGKQMQVDFGEMKVQRTENGKYVKLYCIGFVLSHSRYKYAEWQEKPFTTSDVIRAHENAFDYYGGRTEEIVYDQDKLMIVSENNGDVLFTKQFQAYRQERQFLIYLCRAADPESKGKIESVIKYVKYNFARGRRYQSLDTWQEQCERWLVRTGNEKVHERTKKKPKHVYALEKSHLISVSNKIIRSNNESITKTVLKDNTIQYKSNYYSVPLGTYQPKKHIKVRVAERDDLLDVFDYKTGKWIDTHPLSKGKGNLVKNPLHGREQEKKQKLNQHISDVIHLFNDKEKAKEFINKLKANYPRHIRDQLRVIEKVAERDGDYIEEALDKCIALNFTSANQFRDVAREIARRHVQTENNNLENQSLPEEYQKITATERSLDSYLTLLGGQSL